MADVDCLSGQLVEPPMDEDVAGCDSLYCALKSIQFNDILNDMSWVDPSFQRSFDLLEAKDLMYQGKKKRLIESSSLIISILHKTNTRKNLKMRRV